jgi:hypothetical protein
MVTAMFWTSYDTDETAYADADDGGGGGNRGDHQSQTWHELAGRTVATASYQRMPDDTSTTGPLSVTDG